MQGEPDASSVVPRWAVSLLHGDERWESTVQEMTEAPAYPKIFALGHPTLKNLLEGTVYVQEKVDGSQFSFAKLNGQLCVRSKGKQLFLEAPDKMFELGVKYVQSIQDTLVEGWVYRCEYLRIPKHNTLCYSRVPRNHLILFDVMIGLEAYLPPEKLEVEAERLGIEPVQTFVVDGLDSGAFQQYMQRESQLGGQTVEGVVIKNYHTFCQQTGHVLMGKYVSEQFKETHEKEWKRSNPGTQDILQRLITKYKSEARWEKAVYRLRDNGELQQAPQDIGKLIKMVPQDIEAECKEEIVEMLWKHFWPKVSRGVVAGMPEWYKTRLMHEQFDDA